uniref:Glutaredoxin domain-containing protein n=1 Tax=Chrysotila carterae TaxID=13221 RepID=A0A7S4B3Q8_CHRCT
MRRPSFILIALFAQAFFLVDALQRPWIPKSTGRHGGVVCKSPQPSEEPSAATKAVWVGAELFGKASAFVNGGQEFSSSGEMGAPQSLDEAIERLKADYAGTSEDPRPYFLTGRMDVSLYAEDCEFADPFVSFKGRQRFQDNLQNLAGGFIIDSNVRLLDSKVVTGGAASGVPTSYKTRLLVKLQLGLPWKPVLAWPWGVEHVFDPESALICRHIESWEVSAGEGVRQLLRPGPPNGLGQGKTQGSEQRSASDEEEASAQSGARNSLGTMDPLAGPAVKLARRLGALPQEEADGWTGEPSAWAEAGSLPQKLSELTQRRLGGFKQWTAELVAGDFDEVKVDARIDSLVQSAPVVMFSFTSCPFCKKAKEALDSRGITYSVVELDEDAQGPAIRARLGARTSRTSVPSIWIGGDCIGGLNDGFPGLLPLVDSGKLEPRLNAAQAEFSARK